MTEFEIRHVHSIDIRVTSYDWPFLREAREDIARFWRDFSANKRHVFDGRVLLLHRHDWRDDAFHGLAFETSYSAFMAWKILGFPETGVRNFFGMAALRSRDGAFILGEMGPHTAHAGESYFPAGTPDPSDINGGMVDLAGSVARECQEETGLSEPDLDWRDEWTAIIMGGQIAFMRDGRLKTDATSAMRLIQANLAKQDMPEFSKLHILRQASDAHRLTMPAFMQPFLDHVFG
jgi:8-oxo-dGTP pyrophosphatase MutT (NUDIX family)